MHLTPNDVRHVQRQLCTADMMLLQLCCAPRIHANDDQRGSLPRESAYATWLPCRHARSDLSTTLRAGRIASDCASLPTCQHTVVLLCLAPLMAFIMGQGEMSTARDTGPNFSITATHMDTTHSIPSLGFVCRRGAGSCAVPGPPTEGLHSTTPDPDKETHLLAGWCRVPPAASLEAELHRSSTWVSQMNDASFAWGAQISVSLLPQPLQG